MSALASQRCPICRRPAVATDAPFCSARCRDRDLLNWLDGAYAVPVAPSEDDETTLDNP